MPRRRIIAKRPTEPDPRFNSALVSKFVNGLMQRGKKTLARRIFYDAMDLLETRIKEEEPLAAFEKAMERVRPKVEVISFIQNAARMYQSLLITGPRHPTPGSDEENLLNVFSPRHY